MKRLGFYILSTSTTLIACDPQDQSLGDGGANTEMTESTSDGACNDGILVTINLDHMIDGAYRLTLVDRETREPHAACDYEVSGGLLVDAECPVFEVADTPQTLAELLLPPAPEGTTLILEVDQDALQIHYSHIEPEYVEIEAGCQQYSVEHQVVGFAGWICPTRTDEESCAIPTQPEVGIARYCSWFDATLTTVGPDGTCEFGERRGFCTYVEGSQPVGCGQTCDGTEEGVPPSQNIVTFEDGAQGLAFTCGHGFENVRPPLQADWCGESSEPVCDCACELLEQ